MSRIGEKPIELPAGATISIEGSHLTAKGGKGELSLDLLEGISATVEGNTVVVKRANDSLKAFHGLSRSLIANMAEGVTTGYSKELEIQGVGFRAAIQGTTHTRRRQQQGNDTGRRVIGVLNKPAVLAFVLPAQPACQAELVVDSPGGVTVDRVVVRILLRI